MANLTNNYLTHTHRHYSQMSDAIYLPVLEVIKNKICADRNATSNINIESCAWLVYYDDDYYVRKLDRTNKNHVDIVKRILCDDTDTFTRWQKNEEKVLIISLKCIEDGCEVWSKLYNSYIFGKNFCWSCFKSKSKLICPDCNVARYCGEKCQAKAEHHSTFCWAIANQHNKPKLSASAPEFKPFRSASADSSPNMGYKTFSGLATSSSPIGGRKLSSLNESNESESELSTSSTSSQGVQDALFPQGPLVRSTSCASFGFDSFESDVPIPRIVKSPAKSGSNNSGSGYSRKPKVFVSENKYGNYRKK